MTTEHNKKRRKIWKWIAGIFLGLTVLALIGGYFLKTYLFDRWKPLLSKQLQELVLTSTDSLYRMEYSDFDLNVVSGNAVVTDFKLIPDTAVYKRLIAQKKAPDNIYTLGVKQLIVKNLQAKRAYQQKKLDIETIFIDQPSLEILNQRQSYNDTVKVGKPQTPYQLIKRIFKEVHIGSVVMNDINFNFINQNFDKPRTTTLKNLNIGISDILIDSTSAHDPSRFYYTKSVDVRLKDYRIALPDSLYLFKLGELTFSTSQRTILLKKARMQARYNKVDFYKKLKYSEDRYDLSFGKIAIDNIDLQLFLRDQRIKSGKVCIDSANVEVYTNNAYPKHVKVKKHAYPHQQLQRVQQNLIVDTLLIDHTNISYAEADKASAQTGVISFNNTHGSFYNVTNDPAIKKKNRYMTARLNTQLMNKAPLLVTFKFDLVDKDGAFSYTGNLGKFDGRALNKITRPLGMVGVESANINKLKFNVNANEHVANGKLEFYYTDLKIQLLKRNKGETTLQKQGFISTLANTFVLMSSNPKSNGEFVPGPIHYRREPTASFFNFIWRSLLDGLKPSVGFDAKTENKIDKTVAKVDKLVSKFKKWKKKRAERRKLREEKKAQEAKNDVKQKTDSNGEQ